MLTLLLLRHAKAVAHGRNDDFSRGLTERGENDALRLGQQLGAVGPLPAFSFVSASDRTRRTFQLVEQGCGQRLTARFEESLYNATASQIGDILKIADPACPILMVVGHNPGIMDAAVLLARDGDPIDMSRLRNRFPPGALAVLTFDTHSWVDARSRGGRLDLLLMPEDLAPTG